jgi:hypothetical protein
MSDSHGYAQPEPELAECADCAIDELEAELREFPRYGGTVLLCPACYEDAECRDSMDAEEAGHVG